MTSARTAIELRSVSKGFGEIKAVNGLDLTVPTGVCFGLLGPNGAGKSTTMRMLTAQTLADEGSIEVLGFPLPRESKQARMAMGVVPQLDNLDVGRTGSAGSPGAVVIDRHPAQRRCDDPDVNALHRGGRTAGRHRRGHVRRPDHRPGHPDRACPRPRGREVVEVYGPPDELIELEARATANGWRHRRSGPAVALLGAEALNGDAPEGVRRPANLEDAFVALTGADIE